MKENEVMDLDKLIVDTKALAKEKDMLARTFRGFRDYGNPKSTITSGAEKAQTEAEQYEQMGKWLEELKQYRSIGTVEEFKALKEKNEPKRPQEYEDKFYGCPKCGNLLLHKWEKYPTVLMPKSAGLPYCLNCGQALDWSEGE